MANGKYQKRCVSEKIIEELFAEMRRNGTFAVPPDRELARIANASRFVVRKILADQEARGIIIHKNHSRTLTAKPDTGSAFYFVADGVHNIANPAWNKLWLALQENALKYGLSPKLALLRDASEAAKKIPAENLNASIFVATTLDKKIIEYLSVGALIHTDEEMIPHLKHVICLDNYEAGRLAAKKLFEYGYKTPAVVNLHTPSNWHPGEYRMYERRKAGFTDFCCAHGMRSAEIRIPTGKAIEKIVQEIFTAERIIESGAHDSVFFISDPDVDYFYEALIEAGGKIPEKIGLITVNSFDKAIKHTPVIDSISHATHSVAEKILEAVLKTIGDPDCRPGHMLISPKVHDGKTLRRSDNLKK